MVHDCGALLGSALGFDWANRHRKSVKGIADMEAIVQPRGWDHWDVMNMRVFLQALRSEAGEKMVLEVNSSPRRSFQEPYWRTLSLRRWRNIDGRSHSLPRGDDRRRAHRPRDKELA